MDLLPLAIDDQGNVLAVHGDSRIFAATGALLPGREWSFAAIDWGAFRTEVGFGRSVEASGRDGQAVVGSTDRLALIVVSADGHPIMQIEATGQNRAVSDADVERWRAGGLRNRTCGRP